MMISLHCALGEAAAQCIEAAHVCLSVCALVTLVTTLTRNGSDRFSYSKVWWPK